MVIKKLPISSSLFLDCIRFIAAITVFLTHFQLIRFPQKIDNSYIYHLSHGAVVVFFVLSGYVIAYTTSEKRRGAKEYAIARLSRLYSIFFPALLITFFLNLILKFSFPNLLILNFPNHEIYRYFISLIYCNEIWFFSSAPILNGPIWSLGYEFWFYAIFGLVYFKKPNFKGWVPPLIACIIVGPKILLMMFIWILGLLCFYIPKIKMNYLLSWLLVLLFLLISIVLMVTLPPLPFKIGNKPMYYANQFITDYVVGFVFALSIWFLPLLNSNEILPDNKNIKLKYFRKIADLTFPIYVLHFPIISVLNLFSYNENFYFLQNSMMILLISFFMSVGVGLLLNHFKFMWTKHFRNIINRINLI